MKEENEDNQFSLEEKFNIEDLVLPSTDEIEEESDSFEIKQEPLEETTSQHSSLLSDEDLNRKIESMNQKNMEKWNKELKEKGYILCEKHANVKVGFLSVRSIEAHQIKCSSYSFQPELVSR